MVLVETGEVGAMYTFYWQDTNNDFVIQPETLFVGTATPQGQEDGYSGYAVPVDRAARGFARKIIEDLRGTAASKPQR